MEEGVCADNVGRITELTDELRSELGLEIEIPETFLLGSAIDFKEPRLFVGAEPAAAMLRESTLYVPNNNPALTEFETLSSLPTPKLILTEDGNVDILRTHLRHGRRVWITYSPYDARWLSTVALDYTAAMEETR